MPPLLKSSDPAANGLSPVGAGLGAPNGPGAPNGDGGALVVPNIFAPDWAEEPNNPLAVGWDDPNIDEVFPADAPKTELVAAPALAPNTDDCAAGVAPKILLLAASTGAAGVPNGPADPPNIDPRAAVAAEGLEVPPKKLLVPAAGADEPNTAPAGAAVDVAPNIDVLVEPNAVAVAGLLLPKTDPLGLGAWAGVEEPKIELVGAVAAAGVATVAPPKIDVPPVVPNVDGPVDAGVVDPNIDEDAGTVVDEPKIEVVFTGADAEGDAGVAAAAVLLLPPKTNIPELAESPVVVLEPPNIERTGLLSSVLPDPNVTDSLFPYILLVDGSVVVGFVEPPNILEDAVSVVV